MGPALSVGGGGGGGVSQAVPDMPLLGYIDIALDSRETRLFYNKFKSNYERQALISASGGARDPEIQGKTPLCLGRRQMRAGSYTILSPKHNNNNDNRYF